MESITAESSLQNVIPKETFGVIVEFSYEYNVHGSCE